MGIARSLVFIKSKGFGLVSSSLTITTIGTVGGAHNEFLENESYLFTPKSLESFKTLFETQKIDRNNEDNVFGLRSGDCFRRFFSGAKYSKPRVIGDDVKMKSIPAMDLSQDSMGCKLMKLSHTIDQKGFVYKSETAVKNDKYGFLVSMAASNLRMNNRVDFEMGLTFLSKKGSSGTIIGGLGGSGLFVPQTHVPKFKTKVPDSTERDSMGQVAHEPKLENVDSFVSEYSLEDKGQHKLFSGLWISQKDAQPQHDLFEEGSAERWALREKFGKSDEVKKIPKIIVNFKLSEASGEWKNAEDYCSQMETSEPMNLDSKYRDLCYTKK